MCGVAKTRTGPSAPVHFCPILYTTCALNKLQTRRSILPQSAWGFSDARSVYFENDLLSSIFSRGNIRVLV